MEKCAKLTNTYLLWQFMFTDIQASEKWPLPPGWLYPHSFPFQLGNMIWLFLDRSTVFYAFTVCVAYHDNINRGMYPNRTTQLARPGLLFIYYKVVFQSVAWPKSRNGQRSSQPLGVTVTDRTPAKWQVVFHSWTSSLKGYWINYLLTRNGLFIL